MSSMGSLHSNVYVKYSKLTGKTLEVYLLNKYSDIFAAKLIT